MTATSHNGHNYDHDGHNHDGQLGEMYPTMLNELNCTFGVSFYRASHGICYSNSVCPSVRLSVCLSVTLVHCVHIV